MLRIIKKILYAALFYSGIVYILHYLYKKIYHNPIRIFYTHRIISKDDEIYFLLQALEYLTIDDFERRISYLNKHYRFISLKECLKYLREGDRPANCLVLTFDDGYKCVYKKAFPILKKYKIPATVFITTGPISDGSMLWYDQLMYMIGKAKVKEFSLPFLPGKTYRVDTVANKKRAFCSLVRHFKRIEFNEVERKLEIVREKLKVNKEELSKKELMLTWDEIKEMKDTGLISFGAHTVHHPILTEIGIENAKYEIKEAKRVMEEKLRTTVEHFSYPNGDHNTKIENIVKSSGYTCACTTMEEKGNARFVPFTLGRDGFTYEPFYKFGLRMAGMFDLVCHFGDIFKNVHYWLPGYISNRLKNSLHSLRSAGKRDTKHIYLSICDHFEPLLGGVSSEIGLSRVKRWVEKYPAIADKYKDIDGNSPKYTVFFPVEEYESEYLNLLSDLCHRGYGEVEIHLHHDSDTSENLKKTIREFEETLVNDHKLLCKDKETGEIAYGFVHGNWALDNSRPDGRLCGVENELQILQETGCYADFTMPSAPDVTQTRIINSIYYAIDDPDKPKSHNQGIAAEKGEKHSGLLMVQGPLLLNWKYRKWGILPHIENGCVGYGVPVTAERIKLWLKANVHVKGTPSHIFIKLYTHGCNESNMDYLLAGGLDSLFSDFGTYCRTNNYFYHYVSAREMVNIIKALEDNINIEELAAMRNYKYVQV